MASPKPTKRKRISWSDKEVKDLLAIFKEKNIMCALDGKRYRNGEILGAVQIEMTALEYKKTVEQIRAKWKALKHLYKDKEYCNKKSGNDRNDGGEWDEELDELLKSHDEVQVDFQINDMEVVFSNDIYNNIDIAGTSLTVEGPEVCTETISPVQPSKTQRKNNEKASSLAKVLDAFTDKWQVAQSQMNLDFIEGQNTTLKQEFEKQRAWEQQILLEEREIAKAEREESNELFKMLIGAIKDSTK
ncbi:Uncharacterized protein FWK35_00006108 [Aphis craccivora]|uniref:Myb/SANT-like DNA-binding domain-containing protein n=1 Tax=Aphis craccivora TaxID=307492 RepID=A0A6G0YPR4_APHCR|nr:Uncharacterized protein FWK35_00006108 [Aphis craccivora]